MALAAVDCPGQTNSTMLRLDEDSRKFLREVTEDKWLKKDVIVSTLIGGALAIIAGVGANWYAHKLQREHKAGEEADFTANLLRAIRRELEATGDLYSQGSGKLLRGLVDGQPHEYYFSITENWFPVYQANAVHLGRIDADLSRRTITIYSLITFLIEEFKINNIYLQRREELKLQLLGSPPNAQTLAERKDVFQQELIKQAIRLRTVDKKLDDMVVEFLGLLDQRGIK